MLATIAPSRACQDAVRNICEPRVMQPLQLVDRVQELAQQYRTFSRTRGQACHAWEIRVTVVVPRC